MLYNIVGDWIYYIERLEDEPYYGGIFKIKKMAPLIRSYLQVRTDNLIVNKDTVYFLTKCRIQDFFDENRWKQLAMHI